MPPSRAKSPWPASPLQGLVLWDQQLSGQAHCKEQKRAGGREEKLEEGLQVVAASRDKPSWTPHPGSCHGHCQPTAGPSGGDGRQREADAGLPWAPALQGLAQQGTRISLNPTAESGKVWAIGTPKSLGWERVCWSLFPGPPQTSPAPHARASLPDSPPHQAFLSPAWGPDLTPWDQRKQ